MDGMARDVGGGGGDWEGMGGGGGGGGGTVAKGVSSEQNIPLLHSNKMQSASIRKYIWDERVCNDYYYVC